ncbi:MAG: beta-lactamase family protein [Bacteroidetes bacterium]|nr:beta-lactamase family protein [Bacteroidota bacterium]
MKQLNILSYIVIALSFSSSILCAQQKDDFSTKIDSLINTTSVRPFNGVVLISQLGKTKYAKAHGYANFEKKTPLKLSDPFEIMSNSKQITAVLLLREVEKGTVDLQAPIKKYLPYLTQSWADTVTVHQLLNHTHGIIDTEKPLLFKAGSDFKYGNLSYMLLGKIIEYASKKTYNKNATELFKQLKMNNTYCYSKDKTQKPVSGHFNTNNVFEVLDSSQINNYSTPADGIVSTVYDLAIWDENLHNGKILKPETYKLMTSYTALAQHNVFEKDKIGYGYGIRIRDQELPKYYGHTGLGDGFASMNIYIPKSGICLIVLENQMNDNFEINYYFETEIRKILMGSDLVNKQ